MSLIYRIIEKKDNEALSKVIKSTLEEQGNNVDGTVYTDDATDRMSTCYKSPKSTYYVAEEDGILLGGSGISMVDGHPETAELQRMFLSTKGRGRGIGSELMKLCLDFAKGAGYKQIYLETFDNMKPAIKLYEKTGFKPINQRMGDTGHFYCSKLMLLEL